MPNSIKYSASAQTLALKKGNYWIGAGDVEKGPTTTTDYWNGITPSSGGYTVYLNKANGGPSIICPANDGQLISLTNGLAGQTFSTIAAALDWYNTQTDKMVFNIDYPGVITNGLGLNVDAGFTPSYPQTGTVWYDLSGNSYNSTLTNGPGFSTSGGGCITFDGTNDEASFGNILDYTSGSFTFNCWVYFNSLTTNQSGQGPVVFFKGQSQNNGYYLQVGNNGAISFITNQSGASQTSSTNSSAIVVNTWYNIAVTRSGSSCKIYVNGVNSTTTSGTHQNPSTSSENFKLANYNNSIYANMNIAIFQSYNRELSATEVLQNYNTYTVRFLDSDVKAYYNAVIANGGTVSSANLAKITSFILYLRDTSPNGNQWQYLDRFWMYRNTSQQAALTSLKNPTSTMSETVNNPTFTTDSGFTFNGTSQYIKTNFVPSTNAVNYVYNALTLGGVWQQTARTGVQWESLIGVNDGTSEVLVFPNNNQFGTAYNLNRAVGGAYLRGSTTVSSGRIYYTFKRDGTSTQFYMSNNNTSNDGGSSGGSTLTKQFYVGAYNNNDGTPTSYWGQSGNFGAIEFIFFGGKQIVLSDLIYAVNTYLI